MPESESYHHLGLPHSQSPGWARIISTCHHQHHIRVRTGMNHGSSSGRQETEGQKTTEDHRGNI